MRIANSEWRMTDMPRDIIMFTIRYSPFRYSLFSRTLRPDDFRHGDAELFFDQHDFAARHQPVVDIDIDRLTDLAVELEHGAGAELEQIADIHAGAPEHGRNLHRHGEHRFEIGGDA